MLDVEPHPLCRASVIIPVRNEEQFLVKALEALRLQTRPDNISFGADLYEVILLLNNCTDSSAEVAGEYKRHHPTFRLHLVERSLSPEEAHVGTARRLLMDTAWHRLRRSSHPHTAILSTDADTTVARDWIFHNLRAIEAGADVVGGVIHLNPADLRLLDQATLYAYWQDRHYQGRVARLESLLDPDLADPWPRHLQHFGASLACTPAIYAHAGGLPPVKPLEDVAFIKACRRIGGRIRHAPEVSIITSARLHGRAEVGLSGQLRHWRQESANGSPHLVQAAAYLVHRFKSLARLRRLCVLSALPPAHMLPPCWREPLADMHPLRLGHADFLAAIDSDRLIEETYYGKREDHIHRAIEALNGAIAQAARLAPAHSAGSSPVARSEQYATLAG